MFRGGRAALARSDDTGESTRRSSRIRFSADYWRIWWATVIDNVGDGAYVAAVPLLAVSITHDPRLVAAVTSAAYFPWLLFSIPIGALVDRRDKADLMWRSQALQSLIVAAVAVLTACGLASIALLCVMSFLLGVCDVFFTNASQAFLPQVVEKASLNRANSNQYVVTVVGQSFAGPPLGSLLFSVKPALPFGLDAVSFVFSALILRRLPRSSAAAAAHRPMLAAMAEGLRWLLRHRLLRSVALLVAVNTFCFQAGQVTLVLLATEHFGLNDRGYGILLAGIAIGGVLGGLINVRLAERFGVAAVMLLSLFCNVGIFVAIGFSPNVFILGLLVALNAIANTFWSVVTVTLRQQVVPSEILGRVNSVYRMLSVGFMPLGALAGGLTAHTFGIRAVYPLAGALRGLALAVTLPVLLIEMSRSIGFRARSRS